MPVHNMYFEIRRHKHFADSCPRSQPHLDKFSNLRKQQTNSSKESNQINFFDISFLLSRSHTRYRTLLNRSQNKRRFGKTQRENSSTVNSVEVRNQSLLVIGSYTVQYLIAHMWYPIFSTNGICIRKLSARILDFIKFSSPCACSLACRTSEQTPWWSRLHT